MSDRRARYAPLAARRPALTQTMRAATASGLESAGARIPGEGKPLDPATCAYMEPRFGHDLRAVRVHADAAAAKFARALGAAAYTTGREIAFAEARYDPVITEDRAPLAHELADVVQQTCRGTPERGGEQASLEAEADDAAIAMTRGEPAPPLSAVSPGIQRRVEMRDVGRREQSGIARLGELIDLLNKISTALIFSVEGVVLRYTENPYGDITEFDRQMKAFIDSGTVLPMRLTNRHGLTPRGPVDGDDRERGYVDMDDLLAASDLGLQALLDHILCEREATPNYARRMGSASTNADDPAVFAEFLRAHVRGIGTELQVLRDFFGDPGIVAVDLRQRIFRSSRGDTIREVDRRGSGRDRIGILALSWEVVLRDRRRITPEEYRGLLQQEEAQAARVRRAELCESPMVGPPP